ncbi:MAG: cytochrome ubiquinol oxidase subunit I [Eggerthellaceae bacterium]|nr:cytochrome ubiquinol oxidase subunit I [Eggerthellaceae bacterium]
MDIFADQVLLSRIQFALTAGYHFIFVPITIGIGLIMSILVTKAYRSKDPEDDALARMWVKIYTATFAIGVATGITMEFSFGTNWANYSRFVGDIFGAPLAAEALFAFFLESIFLGFLIFGRKKLKPGLYVASAWLTFAGSALSALWILIANSWMQTPAGAELSANGTEALITDFFAAAFNPSTLPRYAHTVLALLVMGSFVAIAVSAWYMHKNTHASAAEKMMRVGCIVGVISTVCLLGSAHMSAVEVWEEQPTKLAMMEGQYETGASELSLFGYVDEEAEEANSVAIPGGTSFLATGTFDAEYPGLNELAQREQFADVEVDQLPVNFVFQVYHLMVAMFGLIVVCLIIAFLFTRKKGDNKVAKVRWLQWLLVISPIFPFLAIQSGWLTAEVGRQPYVVYPANSSPEGIFLPTEAGTSVSVQPFEVVITLILFFAVYILLFVGWWRVITRFVKEGPVAEAPQKVEEGVPEASFRELEVESVEVEASAKGGDA